MADVNFFGISIHLYSLLLAGGIYIGYRIARRAASGFKISESHFDSVILLGLLFGFAGARVFFVAGHWSEFIADKGEILKIWNGGLAFYGAILGGAAAVLLGKIKYKFEGWKFLDGLALGLPAA